TRPVHRHIIPACARRDAFVGKARRLVVNEAADQAHPGAVLNLLFGGHLDRFLGEDSKIAAEFNACPRRPRSYFPSPPRTRPAAPACRPIRSRSRRLAAIPPPS